MKISNRQYIEERCKQCRYWLLCTHDFGRLNPLAIRLQACRAAGTWFKWENRLTKYDFEEEA